MTTSTRTDKEQLVADLAWKYTEKQQNGEMVDMNEYLSRCPDNRSKAAFKRLVNGNMLLSLATRLNG